MKDIRAQTQQRRVQDAQIMQQHRGARLTMSLAALRSVSPAVKVLITQRESMRMAEEMIRQVRAPSASDVSSAIVLN